MKKSTLMKMALAAVAMFVFVGLNAQILTDYQNVNETIYQTAGKNFRVYVLPDQIYSPGYNAATNGPLGAAARWIWTYPAALSTAPASASPASGAAAAQNWVEFTNPQVGGPYLIEVVERTTIGLGCTDATPETRNVQIVAVPTATITTADPAQACGSQPAAAIAMTFTEAVPVGIASYAFSVEELVETIDPADAVIATVRNVTNFVSFPTNSKLKAPALTGGASPYGYTFNTAALNVEAGQRTRYTYILRKALDAPVAAAHGVISGVSQKSDYLGGVVQTHAFGAKTTYVAIVNPTPVTGPIYHIPNNFAY